MIQILALLVSVVLSSCQTPSSTVPHREDRIGFSDTHIDFKKWNRPNSCCSAQGKRLAIASGGPHSTECGMEVSQSGGNIVDAAVAVAFCLSVERPHSAGLGGGGFMTIHLAKEKKKSHFIDFREAAPAKAKEKMFLDEKGAVIPKLSVDGVLSVGTPGFVAGFYDVHKKWGKMKWRDVLKPAIRMAREGFPVYVSLSEKVEARKETLLKNPYLRQIFIPNGPLRAGDKLVQEDLAKTLELLSEKGKAPFYSGVIAKDIVKSVRDQNGILSAQDLTQYQVRWRDPLKGKWRGLDIVTAPPPSAGGVILLATFNVLSQFDISQAMPYSQYIHLLSEVLKRGFAVRSKYIGDPDYFTDRTYLRLIEKPYADAMARSIDPNKATSASQLEPTQLLKKESAETTQLSLMDSEGNAISSTITINYTFGSGVGVPGRGIILNDEMDDFSIKPGEKNVYGLTGGEANKIEPRKRPVSSMTPTLLLKDGKPVMAIGAPGGSHIISGVTGVILNYQWIYPGNLIHSVFAPRIHHQWIPDTLYLELAGVPEATTEKLKQLGHAVEAPPFSSLVAAVALDENSQQLVAVFDPRDLGGAAGR